MSLVTSHRVVTTLAMVGLLLTAGCEDRSRSPTGPTNVAAGSETSVGTETYLRGRVVDTFWRPVPSALVEIVNGPLAGTGVTTDHEGRFDLTSTAAAGSTATLRVSRDGFETATSFAIWQRDRNGPVLPPTRLYNLDPPLALGAGNYTLTITMDLASADRRQNFPEGVACVGFPPELASRTYDATIVERSRADRSVQINGASVRRTGSEFGMSVAGDSAALETDFITEEFSDHRYLSIGGYAVATRFSIDSDTVRVPITADFRFCELTDAIGIYNECSQIPRERVVRQQWCSSERAVMTFTKR